ncbi:MAG: DegT/DnrJ/EryC1/StrS family aminotransferase [Candidatus Handelsmanbacteria bacterium]|nr:DegT/DnrJ/EryC1/StrS family aminotransferase [Candidatus Handelsmanbacteria bacterium]
MAGRIQLFKPWFEEAEHQALRQPLETGWVGAGPKVKEFEQRFADYVGVKYAIALNSATAALHLAMLVSEVKDREVLTTPMTFVSTNHAILYAGGHPVFCDVEPGTLNVDPADLERRITPRTRALVVVHYAGHPCAMDEVVAIARRHSLTLIEDAAQACGGEYGGRKLGTIGDIGCFSFESKKNLSTGDGGMFVTDDEAVAERVRKLRWMGISRGTWDRFNNGHPARAWEYEVEEVGFKYGMNDIAAALGLVQLEKLERANTMRRAVVERYRQALAGLKGIELFDQRAYGGSAHYSMIIKADQRDALCDHLAAHEIESAVHFYPNHLLPIYQPYITPLPVVEAEWRRILTIPLYPHLAAASQDRVIACIRDFAAGAAS